jgi:hypothetical protein
VQGQAAARARWPLRAYINANTVIADSKHDLAPLSLDHAQGNFQVQGAIRFASTTV